MSDDAMRWAYSPVDQCWHLLPEGGFGPEARCGWPLPSGADSELTSLGLRAGPAPRSSVPWGTPKAQRGRHRPETYLELLNAAVTRRQVASRVVELVLALAEESPTLTATQRDELRALAARVRPG